MKRRPNESAADPERAERAEQALCEAILALRSADEVRAFLDDLCTPAEREAMRDRWAVVPHLIEGLPYWRIHEETGVSITTIGRVARSLDHGAGGYSLVLERMKRSRKTTPRSPQ